MIFLVNIEIRLGKIWSLFRTTDEFEMQTGSPITINRVVSKSRLLRQAR